VRRFPKTPHKIETLLYAAPRVFLIGTFLNASNDGRKNLSASVSAGWLFTTANHFARKKNSEKIDFVAPDAGIQIYSPISEMTDQHHGSKISPLLSTISTI
jgi:hypothetical protein